MLKRPWLEPSRELCKFPPPNSAPIPGLPVYPGLRCPSCSYVSRSLAALFKHLERIHPETRRVCGRAFKAKPDIAAIAEPVSCQRFSVYGPESSFFSMISSSPTSQQRLAGTMSEAEFTRLILASIISPLMRAFKGLESSAKAKECTVISNSSGPTWNVDKGEDRHLYT